MGHFRSFFAVRPRTVAFNFIADGDYRRGRSARRQRDQGGPALRQPVLHGVADRERQDQGDQGILRLRAGRAVLGPFPRRRSGRRCASLTQWRKRHEQGILQPGDAAAAGRLFACREGQQGHADLSGGPGVERCIRRAGRRGQFRGPGRAGVRQRQDRGRGRRRHHGRYRQDEHLSGRGGRSGRGAEDAARSATATSTRRSRRRARWWSSAVWRGRAG